MNSEHDEGAAEHDRDEMAEEFRRLLDAAASRAEEYLRGVGAPAGSEDAATPNGSPSCGWCPVCALAAVLRGERTESAARMLEQVNTLVRLLRQALAEHGEQRAEAGDPAADRADAERTSGAGKQVQHIAVHRVRGRAGHPGAAGSTAAGEAPDGGPEGGKRSC